MAGQGGVSVGGRTGEPQVGAAENGDVAREAGGTWRRDSPQVGQSSEPDNVGAKPTASLFTLRINTLNSGARH